MAELSRRNVLAATGAAWALPGIARADTVKPRLTVISQWSTGSDGAAITAHAVWPSLRDSRGQLVLTGSVAGLVTVPASLYSATKWAVTGLGRSLRAAGAREGVRVTVVHPGLVDAGYLAPDRRDDPKLAPEDVARAVLFALDQPPGVDVNELVVRPAGQDPAR